MDLISIIVPVYNVEQYLPKCLDSIVNQTYKNLEIILVDDGSTDNSGRICDEYGTRDNRIRVIHKLNDGVSEARITGFKESHGNFIIFVDSDDYIALNCIEKMTTVQRKENVALVCSQYYDVYSKHKIQAPIRPPIGYYNRAKIEKLLSENFLFDKKTKIAGMSPFLCMKLIKKDYVREVLTIGKQLFYAEDQVGVLKLLYSIPSMYVMEEPLYFYIKRDGQATAKYNPKLWENIERYFEKIVEIDKKGYLQQQISGRQFFYTIMLVNMEIDHGKNILKISKIINDRLSCCFCLNGFNYSLKDLGIKNKIMFLLLRKRMIKTYYMIYKTYRFLKKKV